MIWWLVLVCLGINCASCLSSVLFIYHPHFRVVAVLLTCVGIAMLIPGFIYGFDSYVAWSQSITDTSSSLPSIIIQYTLFFIIISWDVVVLVAVFIVTACSGRVARVMEGPLNYKSACLIVCHNSADKLPKTLSCLRAVLSEDVIVIVADNGSTPEQSIKTREIMTEYANMVCITLTRGNKTWAQFVAMHYIDRHFPDVTIIIAMDDDILLPSSSWNMELLTRFFIDNDVAAVCLPLTLSNATTYTGECQIMEYSLAGYARHAQAILGSCLFASGGIAVYRKLDFMNVLAHHTTLFQGEDLQLGLLIQTKLKKKIVFCRDIIVATDGPVHMCHISTTCTCGEASLFKQRVFNWDPAKYWFFSWWLYTMIVSPWWITKFVCLIEIMQALVDHMLLIYMIVVLVLDPMSTLQGVIVGLAWSTPIALCVWVTALRDHVHVYTILSNALVYKAAYLIIRVCTLVYFYSFFLWRRSEPPLLKQIYSSQQLRDDFNV